MTDNPTIEEALGKAADIGKQHGANAAEWYLQETIGGRVSASVGLDAAGRLLRGLQDGDPITLDAIPAPDLSGQHADGYTPRKLLADVGANDGDASFIPDLTNDLCDAYEAAFQIECQRKIESACADLIAHAREDGGPRTVLVHLNVTLPASDARTADEIAALVGAALEVGGDADEMDGLTWVVPLAEEV